jgi:hypothetical protein
MQQIRAAAEYFAQIEAVGEEAAASVMRDAKP